MPLLVNHPLITASCKSLLFNELGIFQGMGGGVNGTDRMIVRVRRAKYKKAN